MTEAAALVLGGAMVAPVIYVVLHALDALYARRRRRMPPR